MVGILGRNGAGKTTLLRLIVTLLRPSSGRIEIDGLDTVRDAHALRRQIGYLPQEFQPYPELTVREFLQYMAAAAGLPGRTRRSELERVIELCNLGSFVRSRAGVLSGGTRRRLGVAQAMLGQPRLLVVDEPTAGLDPEERVRLRQTLAGVGQETTVLLSTHLVEDVAALSSRMLVLDEGRVVFDGDASALIAAATGRVFEMDSPVPMTDRAGEVVSRATPNGAGFRLRIVTAGAHPAAASAVAPSLEDGYLALLQGGR